MLRSEVLANRQKVIAFLKQPKRIKATSALDKGQGARCCLGHMCYSLGIPRQKYNGGFGYAGHAGIAPKELLSLVGLYSSTGSTATNGKLVNQSCHSLAELNDTTTYSPQQIGAYLESVIEGGPNTPWKPLTDYPETL